MPRFPKSFGRRKSTPNVLEDFDTSPATGSSFRVFERPVDGGRSFDGGIKIARLQGRVNSSPVSKDENLFEDLKGSRSSGASNTNTVSTTDNSFRLSAASTTPSSMDIHNQEEWRSPHDTPIKDLPPLPRSSTSFSLKSAAHTFSFGRGKPSMRSPEESNSSRQGTPQISGSQRQRAVTGSSYASTATPPKLDDRDLGLNLGGDFADMFSGFGQRKSLILEAENDSAPSSTPDDYSPSATSRPFIANRFSQPPLNIDHSREVEAAPYSWASHTSNDRLNSNSSPTYPSTDIRKENTSSRPQRPGAVAESNIRRSTAFAVRRRSTVELGDAVDEDARLLRESANAARLLNSDSPLPSRPRDSWLLNPDSPRSSRPRDSWTQPSKDSHNVQQATSSDLHVNPSPREPVTGAVADEDNLFKRDSWDQPLKDSRNSQLATSVGRQVNSARTNPRGHMPKPSADEDSMFDQQMIATVSAANKYSQRQWSPPKHRVMTPAQFEKYKREHDGSTTIGGRSNSDDDNEEDIYDDEEDEAEKQKQMAKQRRKQEAHMAVYRQQMMKVTGEATIARPSMLLSQSTPNLVNSPSPGADDGDDEDEEVPLAILAAHGFPNKNKPPVQLSSMNSNPNLRAAAGQMGAYPPPQSMAGESYAGGGGRLPVFARNLPQDPYVGAGLVRPSNRESFAFGSGAGAGPPPPSGGLVNVIVQEEISRAMRRGSPNNVGEYMPPPANGFTGLGMPPNAQMPYGMNGMGHMTQGDQAQVEMAQQMQQFMQMQMQFMQMMTAGQGSQPQNAPPLSRASTMANMDSQPMRQTQHKRAMSNLDLNVAPWPQQQQQRYPAMLPLPQGAGYTSSIAPSERSNVGMPGRYRPVSSIQIDNSRTNTMSGTLQGWSENKADAKTIQVVKKSGNASDEDDEMGWEAMKEKRDRKKSSWKWKRDTKNLEGLTNWNRG